MIERGDTSERPRTNRRIVPRLRAAVSGAVAVALFSSVVACSTYSATPDRSKAAGGATAHSTAPRLRRSGDGYVVASPLPEAEPGTVIATTPSRPTATFAGASRTDLMYHSTDRTGADVAVTGTLLVPPGTAPKGGWPVISWGHGTTGVADLCTPSTTENLFYNEYAQQARTFLAAGYAVAATDYRGLGTPGPHSYSIGEDLGHAVVDIVAASRSIDPRLSTTWFAVGHSEGGQAVLFATRSAARHPELHLAATVAIAPSSHLELALPAITQGTLPADVVYGLYLLVGLSTVDPKIDIAQLVGPAGRAQIGVITEHGCLPEGLAALKGVDTSTVFAIDATTMKSLSALLASVGNPDAEPTVGPLLVVQGAEDHDIPAAITAELVEHLKSLGVDVTARVYPGLDHDQVLGPSMCETLTWMATHGGPAPTRCVAVPTDMS